MARPPSKHPTDGELEILQVLWEHQPATLGNVCAHLRESRGEANAPATTTVATMLGVMLDKRLVSRSAAGRSYKWRASVSRQHAADSLVGKLVDGFFAGSAQGLVAHLVESQTLSATQLAELRDMMESAQAKPQRKQSSQRKASKAPSRNRGGKS